MAVARGARGCMCTPPGDEKYFLSQFGLSCKCTPTLPLPRARVHPLGGEESHSYWAEEGGVEFREFRGYFVDTRKVTTKKVLSIPPAAKILATPRCLQYRTKTR